MPPIKKKTILADKISSLLSAAPTNVVSDEENEDTRAKLVDHYEESDDSSVDIAKGSKIRKQNAQLLDELDKRYLGVKVSRKDVYNDMQESHSDSDEVDSTDGIKEEDNEDLSEQDEDEDEDEDEGGEEEEDEEGEDASEESDDDAEQDLDRENPLYRERKAVEDSNFRTISSANVRDEKEKGKCVQSQLKVWENLLEMRIRLQKCLVVGNRMPQYDSHKEFRKDTEFAKKTDEARSKLRILLDSMLNLQAALWKQFPETKSLDANKTSKEGNKDADTEDPMDEEIPSDSEGEEEYKESDENNVESDEASMEKTEELPKKKSKFSEYEKILEKRHKSYVNYRNSVISKWNDKTRVITGKVNKTNSETTLKQIEFALSDMTKSRKRTQLKRSEYDIIGKSNIAENDDGRRVQEYDTEIYDDDDFYHQLLRDLIEFKSADIVDPIQLSKQWIQLQSMRNKIKRKIDTRATKGRRVRYNVHNKLVNYMAPITVDDTWTDLAKNELYNSLFGKIAPVETIQH